MFCKKGVLWKFTKFTGKHLCQSLFFNNDAGLQPATLLKKRLWHRCFPVDFEKFLGTPFYIEHFWWLLLNFITKTAKINTSHYLLRPNTCYLVFFDRSKTREVIVLICDLWNLRGLLVSWNSKWILDHWQIWENTKCYGNTTQNCWLRVKISETAHNVKLTCKVFSYTFILNLNKSLCIRNWSGIGRPIK